MNDVSLLDGIICSFVFLAGIFIGAVLMLGCRP